MPIALGAVLLLHAVLINALGCDVPLIGTCSKKAKLSDHPETVLIFFFSLCALSSTAKSRPARAFFSPAQWYGELLAGTRGGGRFSFGRTVQRRAGAGPATVGGRDFVQSGMILPIISTICLVSCY